MASSPVEGAHPLRCVRRTASDEQQDHAEAINNMANAAFEDWPNEGAFDGLNEVRGPIELVVIGNIPVWASGSLYRTGPGQSKVENTRKGTHMISHWFDGLAHSHRFEIRPVDNSKDNKTAERHVKVFYSSRRQSEAFEQHIKMNGLGYVVTFGQKADPCKGLLSKFMTTFRAGLQTKAPPQHKFTNICVTINPDIPGLASPAPKTQTNGTTKLPSNLWVGTDTNKMREVDPVTLEPIRVMEHADLHPKLKGPVSCAHPQRDPSNGDFYNYNLEYGKQPYYHIFRTSGATGKTDVLASVPAPCAYIHSFFLTDNYVVLCVPSTHIGLAGLKILWERSVLDAIEPFNESKKCQWFIVDRRGDKGLVAKAETEAAFFFHSINAFEERKGSETALICDYVEYDNFDIIKSLYYDVILNRNSAARLCYNGKDASKSMVPRLVRRRIRVPQTANASAKVEKAFSIPGPHVGELPTINPAYQMRPYRYAYSLANRGLSTVVDTIVKTDLETRDALYWNNPRAHTPSEAIFVARPGATAEDDGVLLSVVIDGIEGKSYMLCLDAHTMEETGRATVDFTLAMTFHGTHYPDTPSVPTEQ